MKYLEFLVVTLVAIAVANFAYAAPSNPPEVNCNGDCVTEFDYDLSRFSIPFPVNWAAQPVTSSTIDIAPGDGAGLRAAIGVQGARINVPAGTYNTSLPNGAWASDVDLVFAPGAVVNGDVVIGSGLPNSSRPERIRITGGSFFGSSFGPEHLNDLTLNDVYVELTTGANNWTSPGDGVNTNWERITVINSTISVLDNASSTSGWTILLGAPASNPPPMAHTDLIIAGSLLKSTDQVSRINNITRLIIVDSMFKALNGSSSFRREQSTHDMFWGNSVFRGAIQGNAGMPSSGLHMDGVDHYHALNNGVTNVMAGSSGSTANNVTIHDSGSGPFGSIGISPATGSNNRSVSWDGSSLPSESSYGANR